MALTEKLTAIADAIREQTGGTESLTLDGMVNEINNNISGLNFKVVGGTTEPADPSENMIWVNTDTEITSWYFNADEPNLLKNTGTFDEYCTSDGDIVIDNDSEYKLSGFINVEYGKNYSWNYNISDTISANHYIVEFTSENTFKTKIKTVNSVSGTSFNGIYTPSSSDVIAVRIGWGIAAEVTIDVSFIIEDMVWIKTSATSTIPFNALKKNGIQVYPIFAKQYINNAWVDVEIKSYQNSAWVDTGIYLVHSGVDITSLTGGWQDTAWGQAVTLSYPEIIFGSGIMSISMSAKNPAFTWGKATKNAIDLTDITSIAITCDASATGTYTTSGHGSYINIMVAKTPSTAATATLQIVSFDSKSGTFTLDVSSLIGEYYIGLFGFCYAAGTGSTSISISDFELKRE